MNQTPIRVAGTIKLARYSFLTLGILWGGHRQVRLERREAKIREIQGIQNEIRKGKKSVIKKYNEREEMLYLGVQAGVIPKADFDEKYPPPDVKDLRLLCKKEDDFVRIHGDEEGVRPVLEEPCRKINDIKKQYPPAGEAANKFEKIDNKYSAPVKDESKEVVRKCTSDW